MRARNIVPRWTAARMGWLEQLAAVGAAGASRPSRSTVGFDCYSLGWTEWCREGETLAGARFERLTDRGRAQLAEWRSASPHHLTAGVLGRCIIVLSGQRATVFASAVSPDGIIRDPAMRDWLAELDLTIEAARVHVAQLERAIAAQEAQA